MNKSRPISIILILAAIVFSLYILYKPVMYYMMSPREQSAYRKKDPSIVNKIFNLGLDLQGGMRLVLEIDRSKLSDKEDRDVLDRAYAIIENRINGLGVAEPSIQKQGKDRLIVELPGLSDEESAKDVIGRTAQLEFKFLREPAQLERAVKVIDNVLTGTAEDDSSATEEKADTAAVEEKDAQDLAERVFGGSESLDAEDPAQREDDAAIKERGDLLEGVKSFRELLVRVGEHMIGASPQNKARIDAILVRPDVRQALNRAGLGGNQFLWGYDTTVISNKPYRELYYVKSHAEMRGDVIKDARQDIDREGLSGGYLVHLEMNSQGARQFSSITGRNVGRFLAIVLDSTVYSAPRIIQKIPLGTAQITGNFSLRDANNLAVVLRAGALPAPVMIVEERTIGPSLGQDSIRKGVYASLIGLALVIVFMIVYYKLSGVIAIFALVLNLIFVLAIMAGINATLTLPGIAGLILLIGMAVDANVIIFERIREELRIGKTVRSAVAAGYSRAFTTIMDANITTLITAGILYYVGTGPIKGFAVTLTIGIVISLVTSLFVTRVIFDVITSNLNVNKLSI